MNLNTRVKIMFFFWNFHLFFLMMASLYIRATWKFSSSLDPIERSDFIPPARSCLESQVCLLIMAHCSEAGVPAGKSVKTECASFGRKIIVSPGWHKSASTSLCIAMAIYCTARSSRRKLFSLTMLWNFRVTYRANSQKKQQQKNHLINKYAVSPDSTRPWMGEVATSSGPKRSGKSSDHFWRQSHLSLDGACQWPIYF